MHIMQICSGKDLNGAVYSTMLLARELSRHGQRVSMVCHPGSWMAEELADSSIEVVLSDMHRWPVDELRRVATLIRERDVDVIHTHLSRAHFFGVLLRLFSGIPCVATAHCCHFQPHWMLNNYVIAVSEATRRYHRLVNFVSRKRIETIYDFVDEDDLETVTEEAKSQVRRSLGVADDDFVMTAVGSLIPRKGLVHVIRALPRMLQDIPTARFAVIGGCPVNEHTTALKSEAKKLNVSDNVIWAGQRDDVLPILAASNVCVHPALDEPLGRVVLEAMAVGVQVVASRTGGIRESVLRNKTGILVTPGNSAEIAKAVIAVDRDQALRNRLTTTASRRLEEVFSTKAHIARTMDVMHRVTAKRRAA